MKEKEKDEKENLEAVNIGRKNGIIDWNAIMVEYIGGASQRRLAEKYGVSKSSIGDKCAREGWTQDREKAAGKTRAKTVRKVAEIASDNAAILERIRRKTLLKLEKALDAFDDDATEIRDENKATGYSRILKLADVARMVKDLSEDSKEEKRVDFVLRLAGDDPAEDGAEQGLSSAYPE